VDIPGGDSYKVVFCDFKAGPSDDQFQVDTEVRFAEFPVAFDFSSGGSYGTEGSVIPYSKEVLNVGNE
jgi:hypothetical protein